MGASVTSPYSEDLKDPNNREISCFNGRCDVRRCIQNGFSSHEGQPIVLEYGLKPDQVCIDGDSFQLGDADRISLQATENSPGRSKPKPRKRKPINRASMKENEDTDGALLRVKEVGSNHQKKLESAHACPGSDAPRKGGNETIRTPSMEDWRSPTKCQPFCFDGSCEGAKCKTRELKLYFGHECTPDVFEDDSRPDNVCIDEDGCFAEVNNHAESKLKACEAAAASNVKQRSGADETDKTKADGGCGTGRRLTSSDLQFGIGWFYSDYLKKLADWQVACIDGSCVVKNCGTRMSGESLSHEGSADILDNGPDKLRIDGDKVTLEEKEELPRKPTAKSKIKTKTTSKSESRGNASKEKHSCQVEQADRFKGLMGVELQRAYGPQSKRGQAQQNQLDVLDSRPHFKACFDRFQENELELCGAYAVFYHSYTDGAVMYETNAALGQVLFGYDATSAPIPRIKQHKFKNMADVTALKTRYDADFVNNKKDHNDEFREIAVSAMCSLVSKGPECSTPVVFAQGYNHRDDRVQFKELLENLLHSLLPVNDNKTIKEVKQVAAKLLDICGNFGLDIHNYIAAFGVLEQHVIGGHMLQIFIRRDLVDTLVYSSEPFGDIDRTREPITSWVNGNADMSWGQARILAHPKYFLDERYVRLYVASANDVFHERRPAFQKELCKLLNDYLSTPERREFARKALQEGLLPKVKKAWRLTPNF